MRARRWLFLAASFSSLALACTSGSTDVVMEGDEAHLQTEGVVCQHVASFPNKVLAEIIRAEGGEVATGDVPVITNFTSWPVYAPGASDGRYDANIVKSKATPAEARQNLAERFGDCSAKVSSQLSLERPNVYIYFTGFGGATQNNSLLDEGAVLRWINKRDPKALVFSVNWSCENSHDSFCRENAAKLKTASTSPEMQAMTRTVNAVAPQAMSTVQQILAATDANQAGYNTALSHAMQLAALLVDQLLVADEGANGASLVGDIHFLGYSMGAHAASQVLIQDFVGDGGGFQWSRGGVCDDGSNKCTVAHLNKVKWSLSLGLSGWSEAMLSYNKVTPNGEPGREAADIAQHRSGGLFRIRDPRFAGKANVFNRRMDPTANSDDTFERGFGDIFYGDYNHYSHDYSLPLFVNDGFLRALDAFLESPSVTDNQELGAMYDNAGLVDFDDCPSDGSPCSASTSYLAHAVNRSHGNIVLAHTAPVPTTDGVKHAEKRNSRAVTFAAPGAQALGLHTFDQEDLRGGVELYFRPQFDPASPGTRGLVSYGSCSGSDDDLMPQAFVEDGKLVFRMSYAGHEHAVSVPVEEAKLAKGQWTHLAFTWELPVVSIAALDSQTFQADLARHGQALVLAAGLRKSLATTYKRQQGAGEMRVFANGNLVGKVTLGDASSRRDCLAAADVISSRAYTVDGSQMPPFVPYARYDTKTGDFVSLGGAQTLGTKCKAYRVRNAEAFFGCAKSQAANAEGDMDDITLVWGPGRASYDNVDHATGAPKTWPIGVSYSAEPFLVKP